MDMSLLTIFRSELGRHPGWLPETVQRMLAKYVTLKHS